MQLRTGVVFLIAFLVIFLPKTALASGVWSYAINASDTPGVIDKANTSAKVDMNKNEILLPAMPSPGLVDFLKGGGTGYVVLTKNGVREFEFDGTQMIENPITSIAGIVNPLALAASAPYPDVVVASESWIKHYSFTGSGMAENPALGAGGMANAVSVGTGQGGRLLSALSITGDVKRYLFNDSGMVEVPELEPGALNSPLAIAEGDNYDLAVLDADSVRWFSFDGTRLVENPVLEVTGIANPIALAVDGNEIDVIDGTKVKHFSFDGAGMSYNSALSITSGLITPSAVAVKPGSYDRIIVDGSKVRYYSFDGSGMVYNPLLSVTVQDMAQGKGYASPAGMQSQAKDPGVNADRVRLRAYHELPDGTTVTWSVTADGTNWATSWRVRGTFGGSIAEITPDNGVTWQNVGDAFQVSPAADRPDLWVDVKPGRSVRWRAVLSTTDQAKTPKVISEGGDAVVWEADAKPDPPVITVPGWFYTTTPSFSWSFSDPDNDDVQSAYQLVLKRQSDGAVIYDTGKVISSEKSFTLPASNEPDVPGILWASGDYVFTVEIKVWDQAGAASEYSPTYPFKVLAFERPRISEIINHPAGQAAPDLNTASHIMVTPGMRIDQLPRVKAGARTTIILDSVGPVQTSAANVAVFPYGTGKTATIGEAEAQNPLGSATNRWIIPFWTEASLKNTPDKTVVEMQITGTGTEGGGTTLNVPPYADGIVVTEASVYEDWLVVLQGSD